MGQGKKLEFFLKRIKNTFGSEKGMSLPSLLYCLLKKDCYAGIRAADKYVGQNYFWIK